MINLQNIFYNILLLEDCLFIALRILTTLKQSMHENILKVFKRQLFIENKPTFDQFEL